MIKISLLGAASSRIVATALVSLAATITSASAQSVVSVTQYSYDDGNRLLCTAVRMKSAVFGSLPDACSLSTQPGDAQDRITRNTYDAAGQLRLVEQGYGTSDHSNDRAYTYTANGKIATIADAKNNLATLTYDGYDRQLGWYFPDPSSAGQSSSTDYESYGYDANSNRTSLRRRDGRTLTYAFDALNRVTSKTVPDGCAPIQVGACAPGAATRDVYYGYDLEGRQLYARFDSASGEGVTNGYNAFGELMSATTALAGTSRTLAYQYDVDGNRTQLTFPDGQTFAYGYDGLDREHYIQRPGDPGVVTFDYNAVGLRDGLGRSNGTTSGWSYDGVGRLNGLAHDLSGTTGDVSYGLDYNPASQIFTLTTSNDSYAWSGAANAITGYQTNGLNQYTSVASASYVYDANGNLTSDGTTSYVYDAENRLVSAFNGVTLTYDPNGRLWQTAGGASGTTQFLYDGDQLSAEYDVSNNLLRRYVHGNDEDEPLVWYEGGDFSNARFYHADHQGSVVAVSDGNGNPIAINSYDEYGKPASRNLGRFQYTGQAWLPDLGLYHYKARVYSPKLGRFLQTDPVGYKDQINLYAYVANDPVNKTDPSGECPWCVGFVVGAGVEALSEYVETGKVDLSAKGIGRLAIAGAAGALGGGIGAGVAKISANIAVRAAANAAAGGAIGAAQAAANGKLAGHGVTAGQLAKGAALGAAGAGAGSVASDAIRGGARVLAEKTGVDIVTRQGQVATSAASSTRDSIIRGGSIAAGNAVGSSPGVADAARNRCAGQRDCN